jgi:plastocyanin
MDTLDSRTLSYVDCFARRFAKPGSVSYSITSASVACELHDEESRFTIDVRERHSPSDEGTQHDVTVRMEGGSFAVDPARLSIEAGDVVMWHAEGSSVPGFIVQGRSDDAAFSSALLESESLYTHAFGVPGTYEWRDMGGSKIGGRVTVKDLDPRSKEDCERWMKSLTQGSLVTIRGKRAEPKQVEILTGQTVFFAVVEAAGITITDKRLRPG